MTMAAGEIFYRAEGGVDFQFRFVWLPQADTWRIYILSQPHYGGRDTGAEPTHRLGLPQSPYVCWTGRIVDYEDARYIAAIWANGTMTYIRTGAFPGPPAKRNNPGDRSVLAGHSEPELRAALAEGASRQGPTSPRLALATAPATARASNPGPIRRLLERIG